MKAQSLLAMAGGFRPHAFLSSDAIKLKNDGWRAKKRDGDFVFYKNIKTGETKKVLLKKKENENKENDERRGKKD